MSKKRRGARARAQAAAAASPKPRRRDPLAAVARAALVLALLCVGLLVDKGADAAFDAPKRLASLLAVGVAAAALAFSPVRKPQAEVRLSSPQRWASLLLAGALVWGLLSAFVSPRSATALDATRSLLLYALLLAIGASRALEGRKRWLLATFLGVLAVNAAVSILQARGLYQPFALQAKKMSREATGAYVGNVGYLAQALALGFVVALGVLLGARRRSVRITAGGCALLFLGALIGNRTLTSFMALSAGAAILGLLLLRRRAILPAAGLALLLAAGVASYRPMRLRVTSAVRSVRNGNWNQLVTYRFGAWKAALHMARERPLFGYGPGTFGAEYVPHRLAVEIASRRRYVSLLRTSSYAESHSDYLQPFAEAGVPAGAALLGAVCFLFVGLARAARRGADADRTEAVFLLALLGSGAAAALTWFPMQRLITAVPLLLAAGRAWRIAGTEAESGEESDRKKSSFSLLLRSPASRFAAGLATAIALVFLLRPELARYRSERALRVGTESLRYVVTRPSDVPDPPLALERIAVLAAGAAPGLPGDSRAWILAGGARLARGQPELAIENYRKALLLEERPETDLNLGRAYDALGDRAKAQAAFLRAVWINPTLRKTLLPDTAAALHKEMKRLKKELEAGRLQSPPPLP